jgi:hypothetical protein
MHAAFDAERRSMMTGLMRDLGGWDTLNRETAGWAVVKDGSRDGVWPTARRAWLEGLRYSGTHHLVLQDDIAVCQDLIPTVKKLVEMVPDNPISLFDLSRAITDALAKGSHWATRRSLSMAQGVVVPTDMILPILNWIPDHIQDDAEGDDERFSVYFLSHGIDVWYPAPSLVEHVDNGHSLLKHPDKLPTGKRRIAAAFIGKDQSGLSIDWTAGLDKPHKGWSHTLRDYERILKRVEYAAANSHS